jgi:hypothetical protein
MQHIRHFLRLSEFYLFLINTQVYTDRAVKILSGCSKVFMASAEDLILMPKPVVTSV